MRHLPKARKWFSDYDYEKMANEGMITPSPYGGAQTFKDYQKLLDQKKAEKKGDTTNGSN